MGLHGGAQASFSSAWWLRCVHFTAQRLIIVQCSMANRIYPSALALNLLRFAANHRYLPAIVELGQYLFESGVGKADKRNGLEYLRQAAKAGESNAQFLLGHAFLQGCDVVAQNGQHAAHWLTLAAENGHNLALQLVELIQQNDAKLQDQTSPPDVKSVAPEITQEATKESAPV